MADMQQTLESTQASFDPGIYCQAMWPLEQGSKNILKFSAAMQQSFEIYPGMIQYV
jgi:hypothetical protein